MCEFDFECTYSWLGLVSYTGCSALNRAVARSGMPVNRNRRRGLLSALIDDKAGNSDPFLR